MKLRELFIFSVFILTACGQYKTQVTGSLRAHETQSPGPEKINLPVLPAPSTEGAIATPTPAVANTVNEQFVESGMVIPTIYYLPVIYNDLHFCATGKVGVYSVKAELLTKVCRVDYNNCTMQGSCVVIEGAQRMRISVVGKSKNGVTYFAKVDESSCPHGQTGGGICVDPFRSVAADLNLYKLGDVIFLPALVGARLPDQTTHDGYFIVRDAGAAIRKKGRFVFYTGYYSAADPKNPLLGFGLGDKTTRIPYYKVSEAVAALVRVGRAYPKIPNQDGPSNTLN